MEETIKNTEKSMQHAFEKLNSELNAIRTGRAHPSMLENITVDVYGQTMALSSVASIAVADSVTLTINVWDAANVKAIDKALRTPPHQHNPRIEGNIIYVVLPPVTKERRSELVKVVGQKEENAKITMRNIRRDSNQTIKQIAKSEKISEDDVETANKKIQTITDRFIERIIHVCKEKRKETETV